MLNKKIAAVTVGCKVNFYDTKAILSMFCENGYEVVEFDELADVYIVNTCTVTNVGDKKSRQLIRKVRKLNPDAVIAAVGCYAQVAPEELRQIEGGVDIILGTKDRHRLVGLVERAGENRREVGFKQTLNAVTDVMHENKFENLFLTGIGDRVRSFVKIQDGCDRFCSYCIIPYARGPVRSRSLIDIKIEFEKLAEKGYKEVVLAGIHVASYGKDLQGVNLQNVLDAAQAVAGIERIRMSSIEPGALTEDFLEKAASLSKVCDHFHVSLQSGSDTVLKRMNRKYGTDEYARVLERVREFFPKSGITTDIIVGFPGESEDEYKEGLEFVKKMGFEKLHVFPFSPKKGTAAAEMPGMVKNQVKEQRSAEMIELGKKLSRNFYGRFSGERLSVLFESFKGGINEGYATNYIPVFSTGDNLTNQIRDVMISQVDDSGAYSE